VPGVGRSLSGPRARHRVAELIVQLYEGPWVEALNTNTFLLTRIQQKQGVGEGVRWPVRYGQRTGCRSARACS